MTCILLHVPLPVNLLGLRFQLRKDRNLATLAEETSSEDTDSSRECTPQKGKKKTIESEMTQKSSEGVKVQLKSPHSRSQFQYVASAIIYEDLNFSLLIARELEIINNGGQV